MTKQKRLQPNLERLNIEEWDELIGTHLHAIEAGADMCLSHAKQLLAVPDFETRAMDRLQYVENIIGRIMLNLAKARQEMRGKQIVR